MSRSCSESATWRLQSCASVDGEIRLVVFCQVSSRSTKRSRRSTVSRETGVRASAASRSARNGFAAAFAADMSNQKRERRRRHAVDAAGMADRARPDGGEFLARLVRETFDVRVIDIVGQRETLVAAEGRDVGSLAAEIDIVLGVDLELLEDLRRERIEAWPDRAQVIDAQRREGEELECAAPLAVAIERKAMALRLVRGEGD